MKWTPEEIEILSREYPHCKTKDLTVLINRSVKSIYMMAKLLGVKKTPETIARISKINARNITNKRGWFKPGMVPWNKGKKLPAELKGKIKASQFKKGHKPHNTLSDDVITVRYHRKSNKRYKYIRIREAVWIPLHQYIWVEKYGAIPAGMFLTFKDRNTMNCTLENLELTDRKKHMEKNTMHRYPAEIVALMQVKGKITRMINERDKK